MKHLLTKNCEWQLFLAKCPEMNRNSDQLFTFVLKLSQLLAFVM